AWGSRIRSEGMLADEAPRKRRFATPGRHEFASRCRLSAFRLGSRQLTAFATIPFGLREATADDP
ncbi:hypothetical protein, partial [Paraburkholderia caribensis]|uniref:hypothetical protein n=1 Tax=Paraburkholderia caribensis TaxID=75105 RepID=UPI001ABA5F94